MVWIEKTARDTEPRCERWPSTSVNDRSTLPSMEAYVVGDKTSSTPKKPLGWTGKAPMPNCIQLHIKTCQGVAFPAGQFQVYTTAALVQPST